MTQKTVWFGSNTCTARCNGIKASGTQLWHPSHLTGKFSKRYKGKNSRLKYLWFEPYLKRPGHASALFILFIACFFRIFYFSDWAMARKIWSKQIETSSSVQQYSIMKVGRALPWHFWAQHMAPSYMSHVGPSIFGHPCVSLSFLNVNLQSWYFQVLPLRITRPPLVVSIPDEIMHSWSLIKKTLLSNYVQINKE